MGMSVFYMLSKLFWLLAQPISLILLLGLLGWLLVAVGKRRLGLVIGALSLALLGLASLTNIGAVLIAPLEARFERPMLLPERVDAIVLLGGATAARISTLRQVTELNEAGDRLVETLWLAQHYPGARIILTGGVIVAGAESEAATMQRLLLRFGIAPERLVLEDKARNTDENAAYSKVVLGAAPGTVMLVTSAYHMPRAMGLFREVGLNPIAWPTDYRSSGDDSFGINTTQLSVNLATASTAMKEWIGLLAYHWTGKIADLLPAQASN